MNMTLVEPTLDFLTQDGPRWLSLDTVHGGACISCGAPETGFLYVERTRMAVAVCEPCMEKV